MHAIKMSVNHIKNIIDMHSADIVCALKPFVSSAQ